MSQKTSLTLQTLIPLLLLNTAIHTVFQDHYSDKILELKKDGPSLSHTITASPENIGELNDLYVQFYLRIFRETTDAKFKPVVYLQYNQMLAFTLLVDFNSNTSLAYSVYPGQSDIPAPLVLKGYENYNDWGYFKFKVTLDLAWENVSLDFLTDQTVSTKNYYPISKINSIKLIFCTDSWLPKSYCTQ